MKLAKKKKHQENQQKQQKEGKWNLTEIIKHPEASRLQIQQVKTTVKYRKISKVKQQPRTNPQCSTKNLYSIKRLMSSTQMSQHMAKLQTVRTFSPEMQWVSEQLSHRKKQNKIVGKEAESINRIQKVLDEYQKAVIKQQKQKEVLLKQNRRLKQKIQIMHSQKKYKAVFQYKI